MEVQLLEDLTASSWNDSQPDSRSLSASFGTWNQHAAQHNSKLHICRRWSPRVKTRHCEVTIPPTLAPSLKQHPRMPELVPDVLQLVFQQLVGDTASLLNISLTCRAWRSLALPCVFQVVDISSHNNGRQPELESEIRPLVYADYDGEFRPRNLVSRQRAFLYLVTDKPGLARYIKSFTWTIIWLDFDEYDLTEIDRQTWNVFSRMINVTHLDLASLHWADDYVEDEYIRQNPPVLFPNVRDLRLLGWMHRGLVRAIITSLEPRKLRSLRLDYLEDEGALPNGEPLGEDSAIRHAHSAWAKNTGPRLRPAAINGSEIFHDDLIRRQETGQAFIFPGPMWLPLYLLSAHAVVSLTQLQVKVPPFSTGIDLRSYNTLFRQTAMFVTKIKETLKSLIIVFGECRSVYEGFVHYGCGTGRGNHFERCRWYVKMAKLFLEQQLAALNENAFPQLEEIRFEGFHLLENATPQEAADAELAGVLQLVRETRFTNATFTDISSVQGRQSYHGNNQNTEGDSRFAQLLTTS
jgi:hypothetical protein